MNKQPRESPAIGWLKKYYPYLLPVVFFSIFKIVYPKPDFFIDSVNYIEWALQDAKIAFRPLGYAHFLQWFIGMSDNYIRIIVVQFLVYTIASSFFLETLFALLKPSKLIKWICLAVVLYNPLAYFTINILCSDSLFISLTALWIALLLRFIFFDKNKYLYFALHLLCFYFLLALRPNALYYPFFAAFILLLTRIKPMIKAACIGASFVVFFLLYNAGLNNSEQQIDVRIFSGFAGWAMANNAIHIYNETDVDSSIFDDPDQLALHKFVVANRAERKRHDHGITDYMWDSKGPLKGYLFLHLQQRRIPYLQGWWEISILFDNYGKTLIKHYPGAFFKAFFWPNFLSYFYPSNEALEGGNAYVGLSPAWMEYLGVDKNPKDDMQHAALQNNVINTIKAVSGVLSVICILFCLVVCVKYLVLGIRTKFRVGDQHLTVLFILALFYLITLGLLTFAHMLLLRYTTLPIIFFNIVPFLGYKYLQQPATVTQEAIPAPPPPSPKKKA